MPRGLHHVVHAVRALDPAADLYQRLGFQVGARNRHPWGTHNRIVQFSGTYIELLTVGEPEKLAPHAPGSFSFGAFNHDVLARWQGLSMVALQSGDAAADRADFQAGGIGDFAVFAFEREGRRRDGALATIGFSLAFAADPSAPDIGFFACQEHHPDNFWNPAFQAHRNSAAEIAGIVMVSEQPARHARFLSVLSGEPEVKTTSGGIALATPRGVIQVMDPRSFQGQFAVAPPDLARGARIAALRIGVRDFGAAVTALQAGGIEAQVRMGRIVVGPQIGLGATFVIQPL